MEIEGFCFVINTFISIESRGNQVWNPLTFISYSVELIHKCAWLSFPLLLFLVYITACPITNHSLLCFWAPLLQHD